MKATIFDVAREAGVSIASVSNALTGKKKVSAETRERILAAVARLGYEVDPLASSLKSRSSHIIGFIVPSIDSAFFPAVIGGLQSVLEKAGYIINFYATDFTAEREEKAIRSLLAGRADGIVLDSVSTDETFLRSLSALEYSKKRVPVIALERDLTRLGLSSIYADNHRGGRLAAAHLAARGVQHPAHICGRISAPWSKDRLDGFAEGLTAAGLSLDPALTVRGDFSLHGGYLAAEQLIATGIPFDSVFAANDLMAVGAIKALTAHGLRVPEDVAVVGFDNTYISALTSPPVTTVDIPKRRLGEEAGAAILRAIQTPSECERIPLPLQLIERRSSNPLMPADPIIEGF